MNAFDYQELRREAVAVAKNAYSPYSKVQVGAALLTMSGKIYVGCNVENSSYGGTICAERVAITSAVACGEQSFSAIYVYTINGWPPCGFCRQVIREFADDQFKIIIGDKSGGEKVLTLGELLPHSFGPEYL